MPFHLRHPFFRFFNEYRAGFTERGWVIKRGFKIIGEPTRFFPDVVNRIECLCAGQKPAAQLHGAAIVLLPSEPISLFGSLASVEA